MGIVVCAPCDSMLTKEQVKDIIAAAARSVSERDDVNESTGVEDGTVLLGAKSVLDSIAFVNFTTDLEERITREIGRPFVIRLHEIHALNKGRPALTVGDFTEIVAMLLTPNHANVER